MSEGGYKIDNQRGLYFLTYQVVYWIDIFSRQAHRDTFLDSLRYYQREQGLRVHAYVIMSNHVHTILSASQPHNDLSSLVGRVKSWASKKIIEEVKAAPESRREWLLALLARAAKKHRRNATYQLWTHDNHPVVMDTDAMLQQRLDYIHENPVRAGIVERPEDYLYSSAGNYAGKVGLIPIDRVETRWM